MSFAANESDVMNDPRIRPAQLLHVGDFFARNCDWDSARRAYRDVTHSTDPGMAAEAFRRLDAIDRHDLRYPLIP